MRTIAKKIIIALVGASIPLFLMSTSQAANGQCHITEDTFKSHVGKGDEINVSNCSCRGDSSKTEKLICESGKELYCTKRVEPWEQSRGQWECPTPMGGMQPPIGSNRTLYGNCKCIAP